MKQPIHITVVSILAVLAVFGFIRIAKATYSYNQNQSQYTVSQGAPVGLTVTTNEANQIGIDGAYIHGFLNSFGGNPTTGCSFCGGTGYAAGYGSGTTYPAFPAQYPNSAEVWFEWGPTPSLGYSTAHQSMTMLRGYDTLLINLQPGTRYFYRAVAYNSLGMAFGQTLFFTTEEPNTNQPIIYVHNHKDTYHYTSQAMTVAISTDYGSACEGDTVRYTVTYTNQSSDKLSNVKVQMILPEGSTFIRTSKGNYFENANVVSLDLGTVAAKSNGTVMVEVQMGDTDSDAMLTTMTVNYTDEDGNQGTATAQNTLSVACHGRLTASVGSMSGIGWCACWIIPVLLIILILLTIGLLVRRTHL